MKKKTTKQCSTIRCQCNMKKESKWLCLKCSPQGLDLPRLELVLANIKIILKKHKNDFKP